MSRRKFITISKAILKAEQPLIFPIYNKNRTLLAERGTILSHEQVHRLSALEEIFTLQNYFRGAMLDEKKEHENSGEAFKLPPPLERLQNIETMLGDIIRNPSHPTTRSKILTLVGRLQTIVQRSPDAAIAKIILDDSRNYAVRHAIHTAILCELTSSYMQWKPDDKRNLLSAALTMNISLGMIQNKLLDQSEPLTLEQQQIIHDHPEESVQILKSMGVQSREWLEYVLKHHENVQGTGYPSGFTEERIPLGALLINLSDVYCAKVTGRNYRKPIYANVAARDIFLENDQISEATIIEVFVKILGLYPPGSIVKLKSGELAIVVKRSERVDTPIVQIIHPKASNPLSPKIRRNTSQRHLSIESIVPFKSLNAEIDFNSIWLN